MSGLDWAVLLLFLGWVVWDGARRGRGVEDAEGFFLAGRQMRWWAMGLSVMATQASAITLLSTTGHGFEHGMHWLHVYLALPFAMVILCATVVPWFLRARVFTAYEYLEQRFDVTTRTLASVMFLVSRGLATGTILYAPSVVLSIVLGLSEWQGILLMGVLAVGYTSIGGVAAVIHTDVKQMAVMVIGIVACLVLVILDLPDGVGLGAALDLAGASGKLEAVRVQTDFRTILSDQYNLVTALVAGLFLFLGYFGADQSQVQRYLTGRDERESRRSLLLSAFAKVPMQFVILLLGALVFVHYLFAPRPVLFREAELEAAVETPAQQAALADLQQRFRAVREEQSAATTAFLEARAAGVGLEGAGLQLREANGAVRDLHHDGVKMLEEVRGSRVNDTNFIFPHFLVTTLPAGLLGLVIAAVFAAAMSSLDSALTALSSSTVMDLYVRARGGRDSPAQVLRAGRLATMFWGVFATGTAFVVGNLGPMIEVINKIGSMFYGALFGVFLLGWLLPSARGAVGWLSLAGGFGCVLFTHFVVNAHKIMVDGVERVPVGFLWYNLIGVLGVLGIGVLLAGLSRVGRRGPAAAGP